MSTQAYFDCFSGISGDMVLGACVDLGVPLKWLKNELNEKLSLSGYDITAGTVMRHGLTAQKVTIRIEKDEDSRDYAKIRSMIEQSRFTGTIKEKSLEIFERIAVAESEIHGCEKEKVHFHEVGGVDAVVDIVGSVLCMEYLGIKRVVSSKLPLGKGFTSCMHGTIPIPSPATIAILKDVPVYGSGIESELVTPTGAAIIVSIADRFENLPEITVKNIGMGAGSRKLENIPNILRIITGEFHSESNEQVVMVETCIDDMNPEIYGFLMECLFEDGALDVYWIPVFMKKNRPGTMIQVICRLDCRDKIIKRILSETTSTGLRFYHVQRQILERKHTVIESQFGRINVKQVKGPDGSIKNIPEYEDCKKIAREKNIPIKVVYDTIAKEAEA